MYFAKRSVSYSNTAADSGVFPVGKGLCYSECHPSILFILFHWNIAKEIAGLTIKIFAQCIQG